MTGVGWRGSGMTRVALSRRRDDGMALRDSGVPPDIVVPDLIRDPFSTRAGQRQWIPDIAARFRDDGRRCSGMAVVRKAPVSSEAGVRPLLSGLVDSTDVHVCVNFSKVKEIVLYRMGSGRCPVEEFLDSLGSKQAQKAAWILRLVEELDPVPTRYFKKLHGSADIWEVRVQVGGDIFRILGFLDGAELVVLNHAFQKKSRKTPPREIRTAENRKRDYLARKES